MTHKLLHSIAEQLPKENVSNDKELFHTKGKLPARLVAAPIQPFCPTLHFSYKLINELFPLAKKALTRHSLARNWTTLYHLCTYITLDFVLYWSVWKRENLCSWPPLFKRCISFLVVFLPFWRSGSRFEPC